MTSTILYVLAGMGAIAIIWLSYKALTPSPAELLPEEIDTDDESGRVPYLIALARQVASPVIEGNAITPLRNGAEIFPALLTAIEGARDSVHLLTYVYWTGEIAERFADTLSQAATRGVRVRVVIDAYGGRPMDASLVEEMGRAGCAVTWFHPLRWYDLQRANNRTHRKVLVVDGRLGFVGGVGIAEEWSGNAAGPDEWRDNHFEVRGPAVGWLQGAFAENWLNATGEILAGRRVFPELEEQGSSAVLPLLTSPRGKVSAIALAYWLALRYATETIDIATPYFVPDTSLVEEMIATRERGVRVRLLLPGEHNNQSVVRRAARDLYTPLVRGGVEIHEFVPTMMHSKVVIVDERFSIIGSPNFDYRSIALNDEVALVADDRDLARRLSDDFDEDLARARRIDEAWVRSRGWGERALDRLATTFRQQL